MLLGSCSSDEPFAPVGDGETALQILVPDTKMSRATRAEKGEADTRALDPTYDLANQEANIESLYLAAFYKENGVNKHYFIDLAQLSPTRINSIYAAYTLHLVPAEYNIYILANVKLDNSLLSRLEAETTDASLENNVKNLQLNASDKFLPGSLPMTFSASQVKVEEKKTKVVEAKLSFGVAKVRFTMLYSNSFGKNYFLDMDASSPVDIKNFYSETLAFPSTSHKGKTPVTKNNFYASSGFCTWPDIVGASFATDDDMLEYLEEWNKSYSGDNMTGDDPLAKLSPIASLTPEIVKNNNYHYSHQTVAYIPESLDKEKDSEATILSINAKKCKLDTPNVKEENTFNVVAGDEADGKVSLKRGHFYDIIGYVNPAGDLVYRIAKDIKWDPKPLNVSLAGTVYLDLGTTEIPKVSGLEPYYLSYRTNSPAVSFESDTYGSQKIPYFLITIDPNQEDMLQVSVNPVCPENGTDVRGKGFWVQTGNLRKRVNVRTADFSEFISITPATRTVNVSQIINEPDYPVYFYWSTNKKDVELWVASLAMQYSNESQNALSISFQQLNEDGEWVKIDGVADNQKVSNNTRYGLGVTMPQSGRIKVTIKDPTNPKYFTSEITMKLQVKGKSNVNSVQATAESNFRIIPIPTKYRVYFKDENWISNGGHWSNVHVYAYQPLEVHDALAGIDVAVMETARKTDWIEYSFTGNLTFKGWKPYGGTVDPTDAGISSTNDWSVDGYLKTWNPLNGFQENKPSYGVWREGAGDPGAYSSNEVKDKYYWDIELMPGWRTGDVEKDANGTQIGKMECQHCIDSNYQNVLWPGVAMKRSYIHPGWWYVDLPLLAKPGKTYLMFTAVQGGNHAKEDFRFPDDNVPGVILPNYPDKEAWYLCDKNNISAWGAGNQKWTNEFTDEKPQ